MAIVRTAKGTVIAWDDTVPPTSLTATSVAIANGASVIVLLAAHQDYTVSGVTWNGQALTQDVAAGTNPKCQVWSKHGVTGATGDVVASFSASTVETGVALAVLEATGLETASVLDKTANGTGTSTAPSSGATATTAQADELLVGAIATLLNSVPGGTWDNSFSDGQGDGTTGGIGDAYINEGYRIVSSTGAYTASKTGATSATWTAAIATYKGAAAAPQTATPSAIAVAGEALAGVLVAGVIAVSVAGAALAGPVLVGVIAVEGVGTASGPNNLSYSVTYAEGAGEAVRPEFFDVVAGSYDPAAATTIAAGAGEAAIYILRAQNDQGDQSDATGTTDVTDPSWPTGTGTLIPATQAHNAKSMPEWVISHVVFAARGLMSADSAGYLSNLRMDGWGGSVALAPTFPIKVPYVGPSGYPEEVREARSAPVLLCPATGNAWRWVDVDAIAALTCKVDHSNITTVGHFAEAYVTEMWVEAYGPQGISVPITFRFKCGNLTRLLRTTGDLEG